MQDDDDKIENIEVEGDGDSGSAYVPPSGSKRRKALVITIGAVLILVAAVFSFWLLWGYVNPGWNFKVFADGDKVPAKFDNTLKILGDTVYSEKDYLVRWANPIAIRYAGDPSKGDIETLEKICEAFNTIPGFPGITLVDFGENVLINFATKETHKQFQEQIGTEDTSVCALYSTTYHTSNYTFYSKAELLIEPGGTRGFRNSVMLHECFHMVGFMGHTSYAKSILNNYLPVSGLCAADKLAFRVLYYPGIKIGTTYAAIENYAGEYTVDEFIKLSDEAAK